MCSENDGSFNLETEIYEDSCDSNVLERKLEREQLILKMLSSSGKYYYYFAMTFVLLNVFGWLLLWSHFMEIYGRYFLVPLWTGKNSLLGIVVSAPTLIAFFPELYYKNMVHHPSSRTSRLIYCLWVFLVSIVVNGMNWIWVAICTGHPDVSMSLILCALPLQLIVLAMPLSNRISCYFHCCRLNRQRKRQKKEDIDWSLYK